MPRVIGVNSKDGETCVVVGNRHNHKNEIYLRICHGRRGEASRVLRNFVSDAKKTISKIKRNHKNLAASSAAGKEAEEAGRSG